MKTVTIYQAKTHLSALLSEVEAGEELLVTRHGKPVARISAARAPRKPREAGAWLSAPAWQDFRSDPAVFAPMTAAEAEAEGWP